ncbi:hypothetical protein HK102_000911 [Quaeritorhiza haematococci]|nr:hypothetical protein HK102_000911 [Quaeritorhiza haematococci]
MIMAKRVLSSYHRPRRIYCFLLVFIPLGIALYVFSAQVGFDVFWKCLASKGQRRQLEKVSVEEVRAAENVTAEAKSVQETNVWTYVAPRLPKSSGWCYGNEADFR